MGDGISGQKFSITLTEGLLFFKTYLGRECYIISPKGGRFLLPKTHHSEPLNIKKFGVLTSNPQIRKSKIEGFELCRKEPGRVLSRISRRRTGHKGISIRLW